MATCPNQVTTSSQECIALRSTPRRICAVDHLRAREIGRTDPSNSLDQSSHAPSCTSQRRINVYPPNTSRMATAPFMSEPVLKSHHLSKCSNASYAYYTVSAPPIREGATFRGRCRAAINGPPTPAPNQRNRGRLTGRGVAGIDEPGDQFEVLYTSRCKPDRNLRRCALSPHRGTRVRDKSHARAKQLRPPRPPSSPPGAPVRSGGARRFWPAPASDTSVRCQW